MSQQTLNFDISRIRDYTGHPILSGPVVYWMSRDQRVDDNWALLYGANLALSYHQPFIVIFNLLTEFLEASPRHFHFMVEGLKQVEKKLHDHNIPLVLLKGNPTKEIPQCIVEKKISVLVSDFSPLKVSAEWKKKIKDSIRIPFIEVDAHNIIPVWTTSNKQEWGAYTIRPKIFSLLPKYLTDFPKVPIFQSYSQGHKNKWPTSSSSQFILPSGEVAAWETFETFMNTTLSGYSENRNNPNLDAQSNLSPYLHFGQISVQRLIYEIHSAKAPQKDKEAFIEEALIRRELSENYCFYNSNYDNFSGFPKWAQESLNKHRNDKREYIYSLDEFEKGITHDELWNAAQKEMVEKGKMHGYMRMYWAKKILEWTDAPEEAQKIAIYLNDKYEFDGRDPNGYTGIAWSIGGVHDRPWFDRPIYGQIRYMNYNGCKKKFNIPAYVQKNN